MKEKELTSRLISTVGAKSAIGCSGRNVKYSIYYLDADEGYYYDELDQIKNKYSNKDVCFARFKSNYIGFVKKHKIDPNFITCASGSTTDPKKILQDRVNYLQADDIRKYLEKSKKMFLLPWYFDVNKYLEKFSFYIKFNRNTLSELYLFLSQERYITEFPLAVGLFLKYENEFPDMNDYIKMVLAVIQGVNNRLHSYYIQNEYIVGSYSNPKINCVKVSQYAFKLKRFAQEGDVQTRLIHDRDLNSRFGNFDCSEQINQALLPDFIEWPETVEELITFKF